MFVIGANLTPNEALNTLQGKYGEFSFPKTLAVENLMPMDIVEPWIGLFLDSNIKEKGVSKGEFTFPTFGHLMKFETDMETLAKLNGYARAVIIDDVEQTETKQMAGDASTQKQVGDAAPSEAEPNAETEPKKRGRQANKEGAN